MPVPAPSAPSAPIAPTATSPWTRWALACAAAGVLAAGAFGVLRLPLHAAPPEQAAKGMFLAPLVGVNDTCLELPSATPAAPAAAAPPLAHQCAGPEGSASALLEATLGGLQGPGAASPTYPIGYTLAVPLLQLYRAQGDGWSIDPERVARVARTLAANTRPAVLYLFSTHFSSGAPIEAALAQDPANLAETRDGPLPIGSYYGAPLYNWSVARQDNPLTARREEAIGAVLGQICALPQAARSHIRGVTLLGEVHQLFPDFEAGMGFGGAYRITDYSGASVQGFRTFLQTQFGSLAQLNRSLGSDYARFEDVQPPSRDIRAEPLNRYTEHIDAFAHGMLPIAGWAHLPRAPGQAAPWVHVFRNGAPIAKVRADRSRQDVLQALPELENADTGWRYDLDFRRLPPGLHRIDVLLEQQPGRFTLLGSRDIALMDARQQTPQLQAQRPLPPLQPAAPGLRAHIDQPLQHASYYFNPLVPYWHAFRAQQVRDYVARFERQVAQSCLAGVPRYTHQIVPFANPGWDANKFAIEASLHATAPWRLGVSLYGDAAYGDRVARWLRTSGHRHYGITEFHPLKAMDAAQLRGVLDAHAGRGAQFLSFFLEPRWQGALVPRATHNPFSFDPDNHAFGSDVLYRSAHEALQGPAARPPR